METNQKPIGNHWFWLRFKPLKIIERQKLFLILGHSQKLWKNDAKTNLKSHIF
jgi:hypothetical protein